MKMKTDSEICLINKDKESVWLYECTDYCSALMIFFAFFILEFYESGDWGGNVSARAWRCGTRTS